jgi:prevent-host-death family protein
MKTVGTSEARALFGALLNQVCAGESFVIVRHGIPVARLCPVTPQPDPKVAEVIQEIRRFRDGHRLSGLVVSGLIDEGRA